MTTALRRVLSVVAFAAYAGCPALYAAAPPPAKSPPKPSLRLKANSVIFDRSKGDIYLEGKVHVTRTLGDQVTVIECEKMTAKMKDGKMESVLATGTVNLTTKELTAVAARASFDFTKNIIVLHGWNDKPATAKSPRTVSTGPKIIYHVDHQRVEMPEGGVTEVELEAPPEEKDKKGKKANEAKLTRPVPPAPPQSKSSFRSSVLKREYNPDTVKFIVPKGVVVAAGTTVKLLKNAERVCDVVIKQVATEEAYGRIASLQAGAKLGPGDQITVQLPK